MCGIAGFMRASREPRAEDADILRRMAATIAHRGPDDEDVWTEAGVGLAHRRLAIIDLSAQGRQPMRRGDLVITFNGEIYNYRELRRDLEAAGDRFETATDTEVLLAALTRWGEDALHRLNGMFAFALFDRARRTLTLARDRIGKKPLYYATAGDTIVFGSEIKAILASGAVDPRPDFEAIHHYLSLQYVPAPLTAFAGVKRLPAGALLRLRQGGEPEVSRYWSPPIVAETDARSDADLERLILDGLRQSVRRRMVSDAPLGAFLSGGVDSSAVVALMAAEAGGPLKTFSIGFDEAKFDERGPARAMAERIGSDHHEELVRPDAVRLLGDIVWHHGEPFADPSAVPTFCVSQLAAREVKVVLTGDGGDESFLGYDRYVACAGMDWVERIPAVARTAAGAAARGLAATAEETRIQRALRSRLQGLGPSRAARYEPMLMQFTDADKHSAYGPALRALLDRPTTALLAPYLDQGESFVAGAAFADMHTYLPDDILVKVDVASMAFGLEARAPFLDVEMIELAASIPAARKLRRGRAKGLLKDALRPILPAETLNRPKRGFGAPIEAWFRDELHDFAGDLLGSQSARERGLFKPGYAQALLSAHAAGRARNHTRLWALVMLELWFREWIDSDGGARRDFPNASGALTSGR